jgi:2-amino-4-hydroxy-6-hydroxymethyldihydropteridine diphosphokinase
MNKTMYIGLGSNIDPEENLRKATDELRHAFPGISYSAVYRTAPQNYEEQEDFLNAVARIETDDPPEVILQTLRGTETHLGKSEPFRFGPRTIDLDLLLCGNESMKTEEFELPHPRMHERRFVLEPLCELIDGDGRHPVLRRTWRELLEKTLDQSCDRVKFGL